MVDSMINCWTEDILSGFLNLNLSEWICATPTLKEYEMKRSFIYVFSFSVCGQCVYS